MNDLIEFIVNDLLEKGIIDHPGGLPHFGGKQYRISTKYKKNGLNLHDDDFIKISKKLFDMSNDEIIEILKK